MPLPRMDSVKAVAFLELAKGVLSVCALGLAAVFVFTNLSFSATLDSITAMVPWLDAARYRFVPATLWHADAAEIHGALVLASGYAVLRFVEGWGLWNNRAWAKWIGLTSVLLYIPFEIAEIVHHPSGTLWAVLAVNLVVAWILGRSLRYGNPVRLSL